MIVMTDADFAHAVLTGLSQRPRVIPARFLYDRRGSELFEQITRLPEYYLARAEVALLHAHGPEIARLAGHGRALVEFGSGSSAKTPLLLRHVDPAAYVPIDISDEFLQASAAALAAMHPGLDVLPVAADFTRPLTLPAAIARTPKLGFFPGSTIGNMTPRAAVALLSAFRDTLGVAARLVIGFDVRKSRSVLEPAYNDAAGITAAFNLNLLHRINRELGGDLPVGAFAHRAVWNEALGRIEMHLVARRNIAFRIAGRSFHMQAGESIHTENSYKYTLAEARLLARAAGWEPHALWTDAHNLFSLHVWAATPERMEP